MEKLKLLQQNPLLVKYQFIILPAVSIAITIFLLVFVVFNQATSSLRQQTEIKELQEKVNELTIKNTELEKIDDSSYSDYLKTSLIALPEEKDIAGSIGQLLFILQNNNLSLDNISFSNATPDGKIQTYQIRLEVQGETPDIRNLIDELNTIPRLVKLTDIEISSSRNSLKAQAQITIKTFFQELPKSIGSAEDKLDKPSSDELKLVTSIEDKISRIPLANSQDATGPKGKADPFQ